ncbi:hypothetical protein [Nocardioides ferulae]|uniref:hypothetical protein n=1 Tax=Nocardioides ferulae TaxID=2340821 RepID=UPI000F87701A|nr:hypothetical protein [Nocardioides ferulae]
MSTIRRPVRAARRAAALTAATSALLLASAGLASAEKIVVADDNESESAADVSRILVNHRANPDAASKGRIVVRVRAGEVDYGDRFNLWLDRPGDRRGVWYAASMIPDAGYEPVQRVRGWRTAGKDACARWEARLSAGPDQVALFSIPRTCLGEPGKVRVALRVTYSPGVDAYRDWVPDTKTFTDWVTAS